MRKTNIYSVLIVFFVVLALCSGCGNEKAKELDASGLGNALLTSGLFEDELTAGEPDVIYEFYNIDASDVKEAKVYFSTGATAEEIAIFVAADQAAADKIAQGAKTRVEDLKSSFEQYLPAEMQKLNDPVLMEAGNPEGNYVILCICNDTAKAKDIIEQYL